MTDGIVAFFLLTGGFFTLSAGLGMVRLPDLLTRMQAATKAGTLGVGCILLALVVEFGELGVATRALLVIGFLFLTAPVAAHMIARAGYSVGVPQWEGSVIDELRGRYDRRTHAQKAGPEATTRDLQTRPDTLDSER